MAEIIPIVNELDEVVDSVEKENFDKTTGRIYRTAALYLFDKQGRILIQRRASSKKTAGGKWDFSAAAGHVALGEDYLECIVREAEEELGLSNLEFFEIKKDFTETKEGKRRFMMYFLSIADFSVENLKLPEDEVAEVKLLAVSELREMYENNPESFANYSTPNFSEIAKCFSRISKTN